MWRLADRTAERFGALESAGSFNAAFSPDGRWIAYTTRVAGVARTYVSAVSSPGTRYQLGQDVDLNHHPLWTPDGKRLVYFRGGERAEVVDVRTQPTFGFGRPMALPSLPNNTSPTSLLNQDVGPDGRFVFILTPDQSDDAGASNIVIVENWFDELKRLVPTK
jgi:Tol biopolymer transport system component